MSSFLRLNTKDFSKGAVTAVFVGVLTALYQVFTVAGFDVFSADWGSILSSAFNVAITTFIGYLAKNFLSDSEGKVFGKIG